MASATARSATASRFPVGAVLALLGGIAMIAGSFLDWLESGGTAGVDLSFNVLFDPEVYEFGIDLEADSLATSAGLVTIVLGAVVVVAALVRVRGLVALAAALGVAAMVAFVAVALIGGVGAGDALVMPGLWITTAGAVVALAGAMARWRTRKSTAVGWPAPAARGPAAGPPPVAPPPPAPPVESPAPPPAPVGPPMAAPPPPVTPSPPGEGERPSSPPPMPPP